ncbi:unnamed protein product [Effrenium voratum]|uniref:WW domain-containing protein n=1 Tax=Effrenium voratum TaxID=2562239 RepID=A0AA36MLL9_9DINO|nr:unnamed protein product [Effrenium voratum]
MLSDLQSRMTDQLNLNGNPVIQDLDLSQNKLSLEQFESLFISLGVASAKVVRFRLFGCATLDDQVMLLLADYMRGLTPDTAPAEMHLSDCAISSDGFQSLMSAIDETELYPLVRHPGEGWPLYLRLENNYISQAAIQERVDAGMMQMFTKQEPAKRAPKGGAKVNLLTGPGYICRQRDAPSRPEEVSAPQPVNGWNSVGLKRPLSHTVAEVPASADRVSRPVSNMPAKPKAVPASADRPVSRPVSTMPSKPKAVPASGDRPASGPVSVTQPEARPAPRLRGSVSRVTRSRTPAPRAASDLPHPWEEHWSQEHNLTYYWNPETSVALWEKP